MPLESFVMVNYNAYVHSTKAFGGKPKRHREIAADFDGYVGELAGQGHGGQDKLDGAITKDEKDGLLQVLRFWGALDKNYEYKKSEMASNMRGFDVRSGRRAGAAAGRFRSHPDEGIVQRRHVVLGRSRARSMNSRRPCSSRWAAWA